MRKYLARCVALLLSLFVLSVVRVPIPTQGYQHDPSLWALLFPTVQASWRSSMWKSIQPCGTITIAQGASSGTATITSVDPNYTVVSIAGTGGIGGGGSADIQGRYLAQKVVLTNATTVTGSVATATTSNTRLPECTVWEAWPVMAKQIVQSGTITMNNESSHAATITATVINKTIVPWAGYSTASTTTQGVTTGYLYFSLKQTATTTITATAVAATVDAFDYVFPYRALEFR